VTNMYQMFQVRVPPSRVLLLLLRRCVVVVIGRPLSPVPSLRDRLSLHTAARPSLRCRMPLISISPSAIGT
jgi:hypothetical protein